MSNNASTRDADAEPGAGSATIRFRRDQISSGVSRLGRLRPGRKLFVEYDLARLMPENEGASTPDIVCYVRFYPGGKEQSASLQLRPAGMRSGRSVTLGPGVFEATIPPETTAVEIWFERREGVNATGWDSRYGQNYRFAVMASGLPAPNQSVLIRSEAVVDPARINVVEDTASKEQGSFGRSGASLQTVVRIRARIGKGSTAVTSWADAHVFDASDEIVHAETIALQKPEALAAHGEERVWHADVYQGSGGGSGTGVWSRPDAHTVQYRLYCQVDDTVYTDGVLHQLDLPADTEVRPPADT